jgi:hypothetical protein
MRASRQAGHGAADDVEFPRLDRDVVQQHGAEDGPADRHQAVGGAVEEGHAGLLPRHVIDHDGDEEGDQGGGGGGFGHQPAAQHQEVEKYEHRQGGQQGGPQRRPEDQAGQRVEALRVDVGPARHRRSLGDQSAPPDSIGPPP